MGFLTTLLALLLIFALFIDISSMLVKGTHSFQNPRELVSYSALLQYVSRICFIVITFALVFSLETRGPIAGGLHFISGVLVGVVVVCKIIGEVRIVKVNEWLMVLVRQRLCASISIDAITLEERKVHYGWTITGMLVQILMLTAIFLPVLMATNFPQYRMSLAYAGQLINFSFTFLVMAFVEPRLFRALDTMKLNSTNNRSTISAEVRLLAEGKLIGNLIWASFVLLT